MNASSPQLVAAHAKLTLSLRVTGVRQDGFHLIDAEMVTLDLADELQITPTANAGAITVIGPYASGVGIGPNNLISRALKLCGRAADVQVIKNIPHGGGLGGGSADAAAILRWAKYSDLEAASKIGADVPFCLVGGRATVQGIGEIVKPLPFEARDITLVIPPFGVSTPAVYKAWDALPAAAKTAQVSVNKSMNKSVHESTNDLESAAIVVEPRLALWRDSIAEAAGSMPALAGSGATWWLTGAHLDLADSLSRSLPGATVVVTKTR